MKVSTLELTHFRNYTHQTITVGPDINVFFGDNAQGKTNILEAVYLCACARSHRTSRDQDLITQGQNQYGVRLEYSGSDSQTEELEIRYLDAVSTDSTRSNDPTRTNDSTRTKAMRLITSNGLHLDKVSELMGLFHAVIFAPEDLMLIKEGPANRRRFLDLLISQVRPTYFQDLQRYNRLLLQRNKMLKDLREQQQSSKGSSARQRINNLSVSDETDEIENQQRVSRSAIQQDNSLLDQLEVWDLQLAHCAARLISWRLAYTERLTQWAEKSHQTISSGKEKLNVKYKTVSSLSRQDGITELTNKLFAKYKSNVYDDVIKGSTSVGPHRDDLEFLLNDEPMKPYASQGQQRSAVLSLKLAELEIMTEDIGERPVLLLDDVMSELDADRRRCLLESIREAQVFVTCTDADHVVADIIQADAHLGQSTHRQFAYFEVRSGQVVRVQRGE